MNKVEQMQSLVEMGKKHRIFEKYWGKGVHVSCVYEYQKLTSAQNTALKEFSKKHVEIQNSYEMDFLSGISELDKPVPVRDVNDNEKILGHISLRQVLYRHYMITDKVAGDISMFWEIHQGGDFMDVDVVRPKDEEAQHALLQMNKNLAAYLTFSLKEKQVAQNFIDELINTSIDVTLVREVSQCRWDADKKTLWTPRQEEEEARKRQEQASWYVRLDMLEIGNKKNNTKEDQADRRNLLKISDINSVATLNVPEQEKNDANEDPSSKGYAGDPGLPVLSLGKAKASEKSNDGDVDNEEEEVSALTGASGVSSSRRELAELKRQLAVAQAKIRDLSEPQPTATRKEFDLSMSDSSLDSESSSSSSGTSSLPSASGGKAPGPVADVGA